MSYLLAAPESLAAAATDVNGIAAAVHAANAAAAGQTSGVLAAAEDEVSAAIANLFSAHGNEYQAVIQQVAAFESEFTAALSAAAQTYTQAEALNGALLNGVSVPAGAARDGRGAPGSHSGADHGRHQQPVTYHPVHR